MRIPKSYVKDIGKALHRWRTVEDTAFYEEKLVETIWGPGMYQRVLDFESGVNLDFRIWWGFIVWCDEFEVQCLNEYEDKFIDCFWLSQYMTKEERLWVREYQRRAVGKFKKDERIEIYHQMLKEAYHEEENS